MRAKENKTVPLAAPFPYFGGKARIADVVWQWLGDVDNYIEPFFGSGAMLLRRPAEHRRRREVVNDIYGHVCNFWRAVKAEPQAVAELCDWPRIESDLHARNLECRIAEAELTSRLEGDPEFYDVRLAAYWCWVASTAIGRSGLPGPWKRDAQGRMAKTGGNGPGIMRARPHCKPAGINGKKSILPWFADLAARLRGVEVWCGDWGRLVCSDSALFSNKPRNAGIFLDPPYGTAADRDSLLYARDSLDVAADCRRWCLANGGRSELKIALCGYEGEHEELEAAGWHVVAWKAHGGLGNRNQNGNVNKHRERVWFSPACQLPPPHNPPLFTEPPPGERVG